MIFRQLFDAVSGTYTYLLASRRGGEALIIDPVLEKVDRYLQLMRELDLKLVKAVDTHLHADHITGLGALRDRTHCITVMGEQTQVDVVSMRVADGDRLTIEGLSLDVLYTPGHTDDSYSASCMADRVFTGDTLLIRGTGRTDFQNGDPRAQYDSIFNRLLRLPDETLVFPAHDYKGDTVSTIGEEKRFNPRLQVKSADEYVDADEQPEPVQPEDDGRGGAGQHACQGLHQDESPAAAGRSAASRGDAMLRPQRRACWSICAKKASARSTARSPARCTRPIRICRKHPAPAACCTNWRPRPASASLFYCAFGERSAMAVQAAQDAGLKTACHIQGGIDAWKKASGPLAR